MELQNKILLLRALQTYYSDLNTKVGKNCKCRG